MISTVQHVVDHVTRAIRDIAATQVDTADIIRWVNDAQLDIARKTDCIESSIQVTLSVGSNSYNLPATFLKFLRVTFDGKPLKRVDPVELDLYDPGHDYSVLNGRLGIPTKYWKRLNLLYIDPPPSSVGTIGLFLEYTSAPVNVTVVGDSLTIPFWARETIILFCLSKASEQIGNFSAASYYWTKYESELGGIRDDFHYSDDVTYPSIRAVAGDDW